jgi:extradiol dioxygenase family protein
MFAVQRWRRARDPALALAGCARLPRMHLPTTPYPRFHLAFPVTDLEEARRFYGAFLGCGEGRSSPDWVDFDFFGHQIVAHKVDRAQMSDATSLVDGQDVPVRHFGVVVDLATWQALADRFKAAGVKFIIEPYVRFRGEPGEQATMFFLDPFGNALEFKAFGDMNRLFAK